MVVLFVHFVFLVMVCMMIMLGIYLPSCDLLAVVLLLLVVRYPVNDVSVRFAQALATFSYSETWLGRVKGLVKVLGNLKK